jgi:hypothetical protein
MARMIAEVYDALRSAGADEDKARAAATAILDHVRGARLEESFARILRDIAIIKVMLVVAMAGLVGTMVLQIQTLLRLPAMG